MTARPVEAILIVYYGPAAHRATYGRLESTKYTKDYIQLSRKRDFLDAARSLFPVVSAGEASVPLTYKWPGHSAPGTFVFTSADRPHLKWETRLGAPRAWKMTLHPTDLSEETIPGDPTHESFEKAEEELALLADRGAGQPYLLAVKLRDQPTTLHLRAYLGEPSPSFDWANINLLPNQIRDLALQTSRSEALRWALFQSGGVVPSDLTEATLREISASENPLVAVTILDEIRGRPLLAYLSSPGYGLFFDPNRNHDAWSVPTRLSERMALLAPDLVEILGDRFEGGGQDDVSAEAAEVDDSEVETYRDQIVAKDFNVEDATATTKTRGSAQRAFADAVKKNYGWQCAITGISSKDFLVASHVVPWSQDRTIRLDPSNGICLSLLVDRAFEKGYLIIEDDLTIRIDWVRVGDDSALRESMGRFDGTRVREPTFDPPRPELLQRRRELAREAE